MEEDLPGRMQLLNPLSRSQLKSLPLDFPKVMNLLNFQVIDLGHEYVLHYINFKPFASSSLGDVGSLYMEKVVFMCLGSETETDVFALLTIHVSGKLALFMSEDKRWSIINDMPSPYDDVVLFKDEFYAVDSNGRTVLVELSSNLSLVAEPVFGGDKKFLVESDGQLLLVDMYLSVDFGDDVDVFEDVDEVFDKFIRERTVRFKVFKLNWEGKRWVEVTSLGDRVLFLGDDCTFSALASDLSGCKGNCIFFRDNNFYMTGEEGDVNGVFRGRDIGVCDLDNGSIKPLVDYPEYSKLFWPPPDWVASTTSGVSIVLSIMKALLV
jgi:hypothetical protein